MSSVAGVNRTADQENRPWFSHKYALALLFGLMLLEAFFAIHLNRAFYREHAPFFDSCSYTNQMAHASELTRTEGLAAGIKNALAGNVALAFLETVAAAPFGQPDRTFGVWLQWIWLLALAFSVYWYLAHYRGARPWVALCLVLPLVSFARMYDWNGGLPDLRMDLSLYIFTSLTAVWFLITYETDARWPWVVAGIFAGLACLGRATAPVYLGVMLGPLLLIRFVRGENRLRLIMGCLLMAIPVCIAASMFLVYNFHYLYYYYVEWSPDANRHLPLSESSTHFLMAAINMGTQAAWFGLMALAIQLVSRWRQLRYLDWRLIWLAAAAPAFLAVRGAGLNGFVSMPAILGLLLFPFVPFRKGEVLPARLNLQLAICLLACAIAGYSVYAAARGRFLSGENPTRMSGITQLFDRMTIDATNRNAKLVRYVMPMLGEMHGCSVQNVLRFEYGATATPDGLQTRSGLTFAFLREDAFTASDQFLWEHSLPGLTEEQRMAEVVRLAMTGADILVLPTPRSLEFLERERAMNMINLKTREIGARLLATGGWEQIGDPVDFTANEEYVVYRRIGGGK